MSRWKRLLARMLHDSDPRGYRYEEAAGILERLGFVLSPCSRQTSHRVFRCAGPSGKIISMIRLVEKGHGTLKPYLVREMMAELKSKGLLPDDVERPQAEEQAQ